MVGQSWFQCEFSGRISLGLQALTQKRNKRAMVALNRLPALHLMQEILVWHKIGYRQFRVII